MKFILIIIVIITAKITQLGCEKFSALSEMKKYAYDEEIIMSEFEIFIRKLLS